MIMETGDIAHPPVFNGKLKCYFNTFFIDVISADTTFDDIGFKTADLAFLE